VFSRVLKKFLNWDCVGCFLLALITICIYSQVTECNFINYDDGVYVTLNDDVLRGLSWEGFKWAFTSLYSANWHPLTWLTHMIDCGIFGMNPIGPHVVNVIFHLANSLLLFFAIKAMTGSSGRSLFVSGIFALHPMHVESVAWISERKDVLSTFFFLASLLFYVRFTRQRNHRNYILVVTMFALSLMSKPMMVTFPFLLLLLDFWPLNRIDLNNLSKTFPALLFEKVPMFLISAASCAVTYYAQLKAGAVSPLDYVSFKMRILNAFVSYCSYLYKFIYPVDLAVLYPHPGHALPTWQGIAAVVAVAVACSLAAMKARKHPYIFVGWFWFLGTLVPVIGLVQVGAQSMADRYSYVPFIGLSVCLSWALSELWKKFHLNAFALKVICGSFLVFLSAMTWIQIGFWKNTASLFERTVNVTKGNCIAMSIYGNALAEDGRLEDGLSECLKSVALCPQSAEIQNRLGEILRIKGAHNQAVMHYLEAIRINPEYAVAYINLGILSAKAGSLQLAESYLSEAEGLIKDNSSEHTCLAMAWAEIGRTDRSIKHFQRALELLPEKAEYNNNMGRALVLMNDPESALPYLDKALKIAPNSPETLNNYGLAMAKMKKNEEAVYYFSAALHNKPGYKHARDNLTRFICR
jgi:tetratricopeptide (TPR) repeat protein